MPDLSGRAKPHLPGRAGGERGHMVSLACCACVLRLRAALACCACVLRLRAALACCACVLRLRAALACCACVLRLRAAHCEARIRWYARKDKTEASGCKKTCAGPIDYFGKINRAAHPTGPMTTTLPHDPTPDTLVQLL